MNVSFPFIFHQQSNIANLISEGPTTHIHDTNSLANFFEFGNIFGSIKILTPLITRFMHLIMSESLLPDTGWKIGSTGRSDKKDRVRLEQEE